jgi:hypothetical protein
MAIRETNRSLKIDKQYRFCLRGPAGCHTQEAIWPRDQEHRRGARSGVMSSAPVSTRRYQDSDSRLLNLMAGRSGLLASWLRLSLAAILNGRIMQHDCNLLYQLCFAKSKVLLQKCSIITSHLAILFFARGFAPRTRVVRIWDRNPVNPLIFCLITTATQTHLQSN